MKTLIISYSFTGNNKLLGETLAKSINADHISVTDKREVTVKSIMLDLIFHRKAKNLQEPSIQDNYDFIIYMGPFWVGKIARPLLPFMDYLKKHPVEYGFITVAGGALGKNEKHTRELIKRTKKHPTFTKEFYTADMVEKSDVTVKQTSTYIISEQEASLMVKEIRSTLPESIFSI